MDPIVRNYLATARMANDTLAAAKGRRPNDEEAAKMAERLLRSAIASGDREFLAGLASMTLASAIEGDGSALEPFLGQLAFDVAHPDL